MIELEGVPAMKYVKILIPVSPLTLEVAGRVAKLTGNTVQNELRFAAMLGADNRIRENLLFVERMMRKAQGDSAYNEPGGECHGDCDGIGDPGRSGGDP